MRAIPGLAPGRLWRVIVRADGSAVGAEPLDLESAADTAESDARWCMKFGGVVRIFDGDSGELVATLPDDFATVLP